MRMTDLATTLAPHLPHKVVGIRPGEKLHEVMVTADESRDTIDLGDRYVILPSFRPHKAQAWSGTPVTEGFCFSSDTHDVWLDPTALRALLASP